MSMVAAPADRRFRRAHVKPSRRRLNWWSIAGPAVKALAIVALVVYAMFRVSSVASHAQVLQVSRITVHGNERLSSGDVVGLLGGLRGESVLWTDLDVWRNRLLASPWVRDASLRRSLPSTIDVTIEERQPVGIGRMGGDMYLVDDRGQVIDQYGPQYADLDLPIIDGLANAGGNDASSEARAELAMRVIAAVKAKPSVARRLSQIDVSDVHDATVILSGDAAVLHLGDDLFLPRIESYIQLASTLHDRVADIDYVDLRFDDRIYVRPVNAARAQGAGLRSSVQSAATPPARSAGSARQARSAGTNSHPSHALRAKKR